MNIGPYITEAKLGTVTKGIPKLDSDAYFFKELPNKKLLIFRAGQNDYDVTLKVSTYDEILPLRKHDVKYRCTCPAFLYQGADYWSNEKEYLYAQSKAKGIAPSNDKPVRYTCKHIKAVYDKYKDQEF